MNRRDFFKRTMAFLPVPAIARAASLWLPPEKPFFVPEKKVAYEFMWHELPAGIGVDSIAYMVNGHVFLHRKTLQRIELLEEFPCVTLEAP